MNERELTGQVAMLMTEILELKQANANMTVALTLLSQRIEQLESTVSMFSYE